ncbi:MAG: glycosyltransferase family 1 protein, partial [Alphaproteobacteria bacterium]|nr:glycosyltransferase family 1 protein [Alphaproteobacteria bacterium]
MRLLALTPDGPGGRGGIVRYGADCLAAIAGMPEIDRVTVLPRRNQA